MKTSFTLSKLFTLSLTLGLLALGFISSAQAQQLTYNFTNIDDPAANDTSLYGISGNNVFGSTNLGFGFVLDLTAPVSYPGSNFVGLTDPSATYTTVPYAGSGNSIVGTYGDSSGNNQGFLYNGSTYTTISDPLGVNGTTAYGISGSNIVGNYFDVGGAAHAYVYNGTSFTTLNDPLATRGTGAAAIYGSDIGGNYYDNASNYTHGYVYNGTSYTTLNDPNATQGTGVGGIYGSNVVGFYQDSAGRHGFLYNGNTYQTIDNPSAYGSYGTVITGIFGNNLVGSYQDINGIYHGFIATLSVGSVTPTSAQSTVSNLTQYNTSTVTPVTSTGGLGTTVSLIGGVSSGKTVTLASTTLGSNFTSLASDVVSITGNAGDIFTAQLTFNLTIANGLGGASNMSLLWLNPSSNLWVNAVDGNSDGGASAHFVLGAYNAATDFHLGYYGVDTSTDTVWAVIDHNSDFGTGNQFDAPTATPEPSTWALLLGGCGLLVFFQRRRMALQSARIKK